MVTFLIFILVIGVLVLVHEWGHFIMAKKTGMKVEEFGFGFPPRLFGIQKGETIYSINWIPFGGFVRISGEDGESNDPRSFSSKSMTAKLKVVVAGVMMNLIFAVFLLILGNFLGLRIGLFDDTTIAKAHDKKVQIIEIASGSPAEHAGLRVLDEIVGFQDNGALKSITSTAEVQDFTSKNVGHLVEMVIRRGSETVVKEVEARANPPAGEGSVGIVMALTGVVSYPWYEAIWRGSYDAAILVYNTIYGYWLLLTTLFSSGKLIGEVSGPVGLATITGQAARVGFSYLVEFVALISVNLAVLNIVPFPALDGGKAAMVIIEKIKGSPIDRKLENIVNSLGFALLIALMIYVTIKDIAKLFMV